MTAFSFRAKAPLFAGPAIEVCGRPGEAGQASVWVENHEGDLAMDGAMSLES